MRVDQLPATVWLTGAVTNCNTHSLWRWVGALRARGSQTHENKCTGGKKKHVVLSHEVFPWVKTNSLQNRIYGLTKIVFCD